MTEVYICGVGMTPFGRFPEKSVKQLTREAVVAVMADAGCEKNDIEAAYFSGSTNGYLQGQNFVPGLIALRDMGFEGIPMYNLENACASGSSAFNLAAQAIRAGEQDIVLAVGAE